MDTGVLEASHCTWKKKQLLKITYQNIKFVFHSIDCCRYTNFMWLHVHIFWLKFMFVCLCMGKYIVIEERANASNGMGGTNQMIRWYVTRQPIHCRNCWFGYNLKPEHGCVGTTFKCSFAYITLSIYTTLRHNIQNHHSLYTFDLVLFVLQSIRD